MGEILRYVLVDDRGTEGDWEYPTYAEAVIAACELEPVQAVIERTYTYSDSDLIFVPNGGQTWPPKDEREMIRTAASKDGWRSDYDLEIDIFTKDQFRVVVWFTTPRAVGSASLQSYDHRFLEASHARDMAPAVLSWLSAPAAALSPVPSI